MQATISSRVAEALRREMKRQEMSQVELAARLCVSQATVSRWVRGTSQIPLDYLERAASVLGVPVKQLLGEG